MILPNSIIAALLVGAGAAIAASSATDRTPPPAVFMAQPGIAGPTLAEVEWIERDGTLPDWRRVVDGRIAVLCFEPGGGADVGEETERLARVARGGGGREVVRVWLRPASDGALSPFPSAADDATGPVLDGVAAADSVLYRAYRFDGASARRVILDERGVVRRVVEGRLGADDAAFVRELRVAAPATSAVVGRAFPAGLDGGARRLDGSPLLNEGGWTYLRWWTEGCPHCEASLPDIDLLRERHPDVEFVAVFHPKPRGATPHDDIRRWAAERAFEGAVADDSPRWGTLHSLRALGLEQGATSVSFLVGPDGTIRWAHPGPRVHRAANDRFPTAPADFAAIDGMLERLFPRRDGDR